MRLLTPPDNLPIASPTEPNTKPRNSRGSLDRASSSSFPLSTSCSPEKMIRLQCCPGETAASHQVSARCPLQLDKDVDAHGRGLPARGLLNVAEVAGRLGISRTSVYRLVDGRKLPFHKVGGALRFSRRDLKAFLVRTRVASLNENKIWEQEK